MQTMDFDEQFLCDGWRNGEIRTQNRTAVLQIKLGVVPNKKLRRSKLQLANVRMIPVMTKNL